MIVKMSYLHNFDQWINESFMSDWKNFWNFGKLPNSQWLKDQKSKILETLVKILSSNSKEYDIYIEYRNIHGDFEICKWKEYKTSPRSSGELKDIVTIIIYDATMDSDPKIVIDIKNNKMNVGTAYINFTKREIETTIGDLSFLLINDKS